MSSLKTQTLQKRLIDFTLLLFGTALFSFAVTFILKPNGLITGGITGLSLLADRITAMPIVSVWGRGTGLEGMTA